MSPDDVRATVLAVVETIVQAAYRLKPSPDRLA
jgi:hypothetical protein